MAQVTVDFTANLARFSSQIDKATNDLSKFQTNASRISANINRTFGAIGIGISAAGIVNFGRQAIESAREAEQASARIRATLKATDSAAGLTIEQLDNLAEALAQSTQFDDDALRNAEAAFLKFGNIQQGVFERGIKLSTDLAAFLGTDVADAAQTVGKALSSPTEGVGALERQIGKLSDAQEKSIQNFVETGNVAAAQTAILDVLQSKIGGTADEMNKGWTKATRDLDKAWGELLETVGKTDLAQTEFSALAGILTDIKEQLEGTSDTYRNTLAQMLKDTAKYMPGINTLLSYGLGSVLETDPNAPQQSASGTIKRRTPVLPKAIFENPLAKPLNKSPSLRNVDRDAEAAQRFVEALTKEVETLGLSEIGLKRYEAAHLKLKPAQREIVDGALAKIQAYEDEQKQLDKLNEAYENHQRVMDDFNDRETQAFEEQGANEAETEESLKRDAKLIREMLDPTIKLYDEIGKVQALQSNGLLDQEEADAAIKKLEDDFEKSKKVAEDTVNVAKELGLTFSSAFEDAIVGGKDFREILSGIEQDIIRIITRKLVTEPAAEAISDFVGDFNFGDFFGGLFNANGNAFDQSGVMAFANGGVVRSATPFSFGGGKLGVMGEAGPEAILPLKRGPNGQLGVQAGGSSPTVFNYYIQTPDANSFRKSQPQIMAEAQRGLNRGRRVT